MSRESWLASLSSGSNAVEMKSGKPIPVRVAEIKKGRIWYDDVAGGPGLRAVSASNGISADLSRHLIPPDEDDDVDNPIVRSWMGIIT